MLNHPLESGVSNIIEALRVATRSRHATLASIPAMLRLFEADYGISEYRAIWVGSWDSLIRWNVPRQ
jgi:hypothetical protein